MPPPLQNHKFDWNTWNPSTPHKFDLIHEWSLRSDLATMRRKYFDEASYVKFDVFTLYANTELLLTEFLIQQHQSDQDLQEENFGRALIYYIKTASDWNIKYIMARNDAGRIKNFYCQKNSCIIWYFLSELSRRIGDFILLKLPEYKMSEKFITSEFFLI